MSRMLDRFAEETLVQKIYGTTILAIAAPRLGTPNDVYDEQNMPSRVSMLFDEPEEQVIPVFRDTGCAMLPADPFEAYRQRQEQQGKLEA